MSLVSVKRPIVVRRSDFPTEESFRAIQEMAYAIRQIQNEFANAINVIGSTAFAYNVAGGLAIGTSWEDIPFDTNPFQLSELSLDSGGITTVNTEGTYDISFESSAEVTDTNKAHTDWRMVVDEGSGYIEEPGSLAFGYHNDRDDGSGSVSINLVRDFKEGDKFKFQGRSNGAVEILANSGRLKVRRVG